MLEFGCFAVAAYETAASFLLSSLLLEVLPESARQRLIMQSALQVLQQLPRSWRLLLLTFSSSVSVYRLAHSGLVTADVVSGEWPSPAGSARQQQQEPPGLPIQAAGPLHAASLLSCQRMAEQVIDSWRYVLCCAVLCSFVLLGVLLCATA